MSSIQVMKRQKSARAVVAAAEAHGAEIAVAIKKELGDGLKKGEVMPDVALLITLAARRLATKNAALVDADEAHERELADDAGPRTARDEAYEKVRAVMVDARGAVEATYGAAGLTQLGLGEAVAYDATALATAAARAVKSLRDKTVKLPKPTRKGIKLDRDAFADEIDAELPALSKALNDVAREVKEAQLTLSAKQDAMSESDRAFGTAASLIEAAARLGGLTKIADLVRPAERGSGQTAKDAGGGEPTDGGDGGAPAPPDPPPVITSKKL